MSKLDAIVKGLPDLSVSELRSLRDRLTAMLSMKSPQKVDLDNPITRAFHAVTKRMALGYSKSLPAPEELVRWLDELKLTDREAQSLMDRGFEFIVEELRDRGIPAAPQVIWRQANRIPALIDLHFPSYIAYGYVKLIAGARHHVDRKPATRELTNAAEPRR